MSSTGRTTAACSLRARSLTWRQHTQTSPRLFAVHAACRYLKEHAQMFDASGMAKV